MLSQKPDWLRVRLPGGGKYRGLKSLLRDRDLTTVCEEAHCPNIGECWGGGTATIMLMGDTCTRGCRFCAVKTGNPKGVLDPFEPAKVADTVARSGWRYVVLTSVDRDDLPDGGAGHFAATIRAIKARDSAIRVEALVPDFQGDPEAIRTVVEAGPEVFAQNQETVERLTHPIRDMRAGYEQTLHVLRTAKAIRPTVYTKSSLMLGLGERQDEVLQAMRDLREAGVDILTLGQYLRPSARHVEMVRYVPPGEFAFFEGGARAMGFLYVAAGPLVRSSYRAGEFFTEGILGGHVAPVPMGG
ncbi:MAG: lipoyl synthase [Candidatus Thermoplasmatota archaeon]|nr:lipoyl synthase [Candidatus Thermoplasmatota archaeon]